MVILYVPSHIQSFMELAHRRKGGQNFGRNILKGQSMFLAPFMQILEQNGIVEKETISFFKNHGITSLHLSSSLRLCVNYLITMHYQL